MSAPESSGAFFILCPSGGFAGNAVYIDKLNLRKHRWPMSLS